MVEAQEHHSDELEKHQEQHHEELEKQMEEYDTLGTKLKEALESSN